MSGSDSTATSDGQGALRDIPGDCPSPIDIGTAGWTILHTSAVAYPDKPTPVQQEAMRHFVLAWSQVYACSWCAFHMRQYVAAHPPVVTDKNSITTYVCELHNEVNGRLGKEVYDCDPTVQLKRWHAGYPDHLADEPTIEEKLAQAAAKEKEKTLNRHRLEEEQQQRIAALGLARPEKRSSNGWRLWSSAPAEAAAVPHSTPDVHQAEPTSSPKAPSQGSTAASSAEPKADWRRAQSAATAAGTPLREASGAAVDAETALAEMSPGMMSSLLSRIKACKVFCPDEAK